MALPLKPPIQPQLALSRKVLPEGEDWVYEPKYDGFRALAFVDGEDVYLQSRGGKPLRRYFPEVQFPDGRYVLDGELVILDDDGREVFNQLQNRLHPAESRVQMLAEKIPALFRAFDLLAVDRRKLMGKPFAERRATLEDLIAAAPGRKKTASGSVELTPLVKSATKAEPLLLSGEGSSGSAFVADLTSGVSSTDPDAVFLRPGAAAIRSSSVARRSANGLPISLRRSTARRSKARKSAGIFSASICTRDSAGWRRFCSWLKTSRPSSSRITSSPSRT